MELEQFSFSEYIFYTWKYINYRITEKWEKKYLSNPLNWQFSPLNWQEHSNLLFHTTLFRHCVLSPFFFGTDRLCLISHIILQFAMQYYVNITEILHCDISQYYNNFVEILQCNISFCNITTMSFKYCSVIHCNAILLQYCNMIYHTKILLQYHL